MPELTLPIRRPGALVKLVVRPRGDAGSERRLPAYLDTGASDTMLDEGVVRALGLRGVRSAALSVLGRDGVSFHETYEVEVAVAAEGLLPRWVPLAVLGGPVYGTGAAVALGRDFLAHVVLTYDGPARRRGCPGSTPHHKRRDCP